MKLMMVMLRIGMANGSENGIEVGGDGVRRALHEENRQSL